MSQYDKGKIKKELSDFEDDLKRLKRYYEPGTEQDFALKNPAISGVSIHAVEEETKKVKYRKRVCELELAVAELQEKR